MRKNNLLTRGLVCSAVSILFLGGCDDDLSPEIGDTGQFHTLGDVLLIDTQLPDSGGADSGKDVAVADVGAPDAAPADRAYGAPCTSSFNCNSGLCLPDGAGGKFCSELCIKVCPTVYPDREAGCRLIDLDDGPAFACQLFNSRLCEPCVTDEQCGSGLCEQRGAETFCTEPCESDGSCSTGYTCQTITRPEGDSSQCIPELDTCTCTPALDGRVRSCSVTNVNGRCGGIETCDATLGWTGCTARTPVAELCNAEDDNCDQLTDNDIPVGTCDITNPALPGETCEGAEVCSSTGALCLGPMPVAEACDGLDNDCDTKIDEDFKDAKGNFSLFDHCGGCFQTCQGRFGFTATSVSCLDDGTKPPHCVIDTCDVGYQLVGETLCVPLIDNLCQLCIADVDCSSTSPGAVCIPLTNSLGAVQKVCGRACSIDPDCGDPALFECRSLAHQGSSVSQCVPRSNSCFCSLNPGGFTLPCQVQITGEIDLSGTQGTVSCQGSQGCVNDDFGACNLATEVCNGLDDDCSGIIDDPYRPGGRYTSDQHCGRCNNDCKAISISNATSFCRSTDDPQGDPAHGNAVAPFCDKKCQSSFVDLINGRDDGCECHVTSSTDVPDGTDANCDGIDGQISVALFVAKTGLDTSPGTRALPLLTIQEAIVQASAPGSGIRDIYVSAGVYSESITLAAGSQLYGGYDLDFDQRDPALFPTTIYGRPPTAAEPGAVNAFGISANTIFDGFSVVGGSAAAAGESSYGVYIEDSTSALLLRNNVINGGAGAAGTGGSAGTPGLNGVNGSNSTLDGIRTDRNCSAADRPGGGGAVFSCGSASVDGGTGGTARCPQSETIDPHPNFLHTDRCDTRTTTGQDNCLNVCNTFACHTYAGTQHRPPAQGIGATGANNSAGGGGGGDPAFDTVEIEGRQNQCHNSPGLPRIGGPGNLGDDGSNGSAGGTCADVRGLVNASGRWVAQDGFSGEPGHHGGGGGGGSAGGGYDVNHTYQFYGQDTIGGSGGGGGSGACGGTGGAQGTGGGASLGMLITYTSSGFTSAPTLSGNTVTPGSGGAGGAGGAGALGGIGGIGGFGASSAAFCGEPGGPGASGGRGGIGGGGGGGCGGSVFAILVNANGNSVDTSSYMPGNALSAPSGLVGQGGQGGPSLGSPGTLGLNGAAELLYVLP